MKYEYAGFEYEVSLTPNGPVLHPVPGQHQAASKHKHIQAATDCYLQDHKEARQATVSRLAKEWASKIS